MLQVTTRSFNSQESTVFSKCTLSILGISFHNILQSQPIIFCINAAFSLSLTQHGYPFGQGVKIYLWCPIPLQISFLILNPSRIGVSTSTFMNLYLLDVLIVCRGGMSGELKESFLNDLNDLESEDEAVGSRNNQNPHDDGSGVQDAAADLLNDFNSSDDEDDDDDDNHGQGDGNDQERNQQELDLYLGKIARSKTFHGVSELRISEKYQTHLNKVLTALSHEDDNDGSDSDGDGHHEGGAVEDDPDYQLVMACNSMILEIDEEIIGIHRYVLDIYNKKFPELESLIPNRIDYVKTVLRIGNEMDMTLVELNDLLPSATVMVVSVTGSTTSGQPLTEEDLTSCYQGCHELLTLDADKTSILKYVQSKMNSIAPNTSALLGSRITAQLIGLTGGITALSRIPACNIQVIGQEKRLMAGFSNLSSLPHQGIIQYCDLLQSSTPIFLRKKILKLISSKVAISSRVDSYKHSTTGAEGVKLRNYILEQIEKLQSPSKAQTKKSLPKPEEKKKSHRGGKRVRKWKERFAVTEMRALQNRIGMSVNDGEYGDSAMGVDLGMLSSKGKQMGKLRAPQKKEIKIGKKPKLGNSGTSMAMSSGQTNGLSSSLVFTPVQGLELINPNAAADRVKDANQKWFNATSGFLSAVPKPK
jgi:U4/U6 small nuclear ribonucleoprotein PRP31